MDTKEQIDKLINDVVGGPNDADIAASETLNAPGADEAPPVESKPIDPRGVIKDLQGERRKTREAREKAEEEAAKSRQLEIDNAYLRGKLEGGGDKTTEISPLERAAQEQQCSVDDVVITGKLHREQIEWDKKKLQSATELPTGNKAQEDAIAAGIEDLKINLTAENLGDGLGSDVILAMGAKYFSPGDRKAIAASGRQCGRMMYAKALQRIQSQGTPAEKQHIAASVRRREAAVANVQMEEAGPSRGEETTIATNLEPRVGRLLHNLDNPGPEE